MNQQQTPYPGSRNYPNAQGESPKSRTGLWIVLGLLASLIFLAIVAYFTIHIWEQPTCTEPAVCKICGKVSKNSMLGHDWGQVSYVWSADNSTVTARRVCRNDSSHVEEETVNTTVRESTAATCGQDGTRVYTAEFKTEGFQTQTRTETIAMTGHNWDKVTYTWSKDHSSVTAKRVCKNDSSHVEEETVKATGKTTVKATCKKEGKRVYTSAEFTNGAFAVQTAEVSIAKADHDWGTVTYTWSKDHSSVTAKRVCKNDSSHVEEETVKATGKTTVKASCKKEGKCVYTSAKFKNSAFAVQTAEVSIAKTDHDWGKVSYSWSKDHKTAYASRSCKNCGKEDTASTTNISYAVTKEPSCTKSGTCVYTATFKNADFGTCQETATLAAKGHDWIPATTTAPKTCRVCGATEGERLKTDYEKLVEKIRNYDSKIELPAENEMLSKPVTRYVRGKNPPPSGGIYLCREPGDDIILKLDNYTPLTVYAVRGSLSSGFALVETSGGKLGWVRTDRLSETSDFTY